VFVERKGNIGLERQARAFEDDLWGKFAHGGIILNTVLSALCGSFLKILKNT
jgi:hypothetical protein